MREIILALTENLIWLKNPRIELLGLFGVFMSFWRSEKLWKIHSRLIKSRFFCLIRGVTWDDCIFNSNFVTPELLIYSGKICCTLSSSRKVFFLWKKFFKKAGWIWYHSARNPKNKNLLPWFVSSERSWQILKTWKMGRLWRGGVWLILNWFSLISFL